MFMSNHDFQKVVALYQNILDDKILKVLLIKISNNPLIAKYCKNVWMYEYVIPYMCTKHFDLL